MVPLGVATRLLDKERDMLTLHIGVAPDLVGDLSTDNDHWEQWGEERPAGEAVHVTLDFIEEGDALRELGALMVDHDLELVPMHEAHQVGTLAVITHQDDWSVPIIIITDARM